MSSSTATTFSTEALTLRSILTTIPEAAAVASIITKALLHPIDTIKCRVQAAPLGTSFADFLKHYKGRWTARHLYGGLPIKLVLYAPYQSMYMTSYDGSKLLIHRALGEERSQSSLGRTLVALGGATAAEVGSSIVRVPMEAIKMRVQAAVTHNTQSAITDLMRHGRRRVAKLFVPQTLCHDLPYSCIQWLAYEHLRPPLLAAVKSWGENHMAFDSHNSSNSSSSGGGLHVSWLYSIASFLVGGCSGLVAATLTVPLDTVKTRVIVRAGVSDGLVPSTWETATAMVREGGYRSLFRGGMWRVLWITSNMSVYFALFDVLKQILGTQK